MAKNFWQGKDADVLAGSVAFSAKITATPVVYGLSAAQASSYAATHLLYANALALVTDPITRTKGNTEAKRVAKKNLQDMASDLAKIIDGTPTVTNAQKIDLGINVRAQPAPIPPPDVAPGTHIVAVVGRLVKFRIHDADSVAKRGKAPGAIGANVYSFVGATYPTDPGLWEFQGQTSKNNFDVLFPDSVAPGSQVWLCATWYNRTAETGPVSTPIMTRLQGGLSMAG